MCSKQVNIGKQLENLPHHVIRRLNYDTIGAFDDISRMRNFVTSLISLAAANEDASSVALRLRLETAVTEAEFDTAKKTAGEAIENCASTTCRDLVRDVRTTSA